MAAKKAGPVLIGGSFGGGGTLPGLLRGGRSGSWWQVVVGLEIHAQILGETKLFSGSSSCGRASLEGRPNQQVSLFDAALPGTLPSLSGHCVRQAIRTGLALEGTIQRRSVFERKHYFYCDMPLGFQITQNRHPIVTDGQVRFALTRRDQAGDSSQIGDGGSRSGSAGRSEPASTTERVVRIKQLQLEQDSGKSIHDLSPTMTYVDLNRAGVGLMEIVTEPDLYSSGEAAACVRSLTELMRHIGTCDGQMEAGSLRCDVNVSVRPVELVVEAAAAGGQQVADADQADQADQADVGGGALHWAVPCTRGERQEGGRVEIKNLNSLKSMVQAIDYEAQRHVDLLEGAAAAAAGAGGGGGGDTAAAAATDAAASASAATGGGGGGGGGVILPETRLFDAARGVTVALRSKEDSYDYRFFPEPDLRQLIVDDETVAEVRASLPELPAATRQRLRATFGLSAYDVEVLTGEAGAVEYFEAAVEAVLRAGGSGGGSGGGGTDGAGAEDGAATAVLAKQVLNWITNGIFGEMESFDASDPGCFVLPEHVAELVALVTLEKAISGRAAKQVLQGVMEDGRRAAAAAAAAGAGAAGAGAGAAAQERARGITSQPPAEEEREEEKDPLPVQPEVEVVVRRSPRQVVEDEGLAQVSDQGELEEAVREVLGRPGMQEKIDRYAAGKHQLLGFFVGQVMQDTKGRANPGAVREIAIAMLPAVEGLPSAEEEAAAGGKKGKKGKKKKKKKEEEAKKA